MAPYCSDSRRLLGYFQRERELEEKRKRRDWRFRDRLEMQRVTEGKANAVGGYLLAGLEVEAGRQEQRVLFDAVGWGSNRLHDDKGIQVSRRRGGGKKRSDRFWGL